jgi:hypothetical protein
MTSRSESHCDSAVAGVPNTPVAAPNERGTVHFTGTTFVRGVPLTQPVGITRCFRRTIILNVRNTAA